MCVQYLRVKGSISYIFDYLDYLCIHVENERNLKKAFCVSELIILENK